jgi:hypothetical protein
MALIRFPSSSAPKSVRTLDAEPAYSLVVGRSAVGDAGGHKRHPEAARAGHPTGDIDRVASQDRSSLNAIRSGCHAKTCKCADCSILWRGARLRQEGTR